jgi:hypothetical protein
MDRTKKSFNKLISRPEVSKILRMFLTGGFEYFDEKRISAIKRRSPKKGPYKLRYSDFRDYFINVGNYKRRDLGEKKRSRYHDTQLTRDLNALVFNRVVIKEDGDHPLYSLSDEVKLSDVFWNEIHRSLDIGRLLEFPASKIFFRPLSKITLYGLEGLKKYPKELEKSVSELELKMKNVQQIYYDSLVKSYFEKMIKKCEKIEKKLDIESQIWLYVLWRFLLAKFFYRIQYKLQDKIFEFHKPLSNKKESFIISSLKELGDLEVSLGMKFFEWLIKNHHRDSYEITLSGKITEVPKDDLLKEIFVEYLFHDEEKKDIGRIFRRKISLNVGKSWSLKCDIQKLLKTLESFEDELNKILEEIDKEVYPITIFMGTYSLENLEKIKSLRAEIPENSLEEFREDLLLTGHGSFALLNEQWEKQRTVK